MDRNMNDELSSPKFGESPSTTTFFEPRRDYRNEHDHATDESDAGSQHYGHDGNSDAGTSSAHIRVQSPQPRPRPSLPRNSTRNVQEALRIARRREEQETLLNEDEEADDDGCYPPRKNDDPRAPNPHSSLPVYTTIHKIRRLVIASIGMHDCRDRARRDVYS